MSDPILYFVTPAWQRFPLSEVVFAQRQHVIETLALAGIEAHCVVVADDENLDLARAAGFATVERNNDWLGRKFNDGMEYAGRHGADFIVPIGSDSWIDPAYFIPLETGVLTRSSQTYAAVLWDRVAELTVRTAGGAGPYVFRRDLFLTSEFRPAADELRARIDSSTIRGLGGTRWAPLSLHPLQYVGFRYPPMITSYARLLASWGDRERADPWPHLAKHYPQHLVDWAERVMTP